MRRLSYSKAEAYNDCPKKGWHLHTKRMPDRTGDMAERILVGLVVDRVVGLAYDEKWYEHPPSADQIILLARESMEWSLINVMPFALSSANRHKLYVRLEGLTMVPEQMHKFDLVPSTPDGVRLQVDAERDLPAINTTIVGKLDLLIENAHISLIDVKAGSYRKAAQLMWYLKLLEAKGIMPSRVGFWMPLKDEIEWRVQSRLPNITPMIVNTVHRMETQDQTATPGSHCTICALRPTCAEGIQYTQTCKAANERLLTPPGVHRVEW